MDDSILDKIGTRKTELEEAKQTRMLFPDEEKELNSLTHKRRLNHMAIEAKQTPASDAVKEIMEWFNPEAVAKKQIRQFRALLQALAKERYPRKPRAKKAKK